MQHFNVYMYSLSEQNKDAAGTNVVNLLCSISEMLKHDDRRGVHVLTFNSVGDFSGHILSLLVLKLYICSLSLLL